MRRHIGAFFAQQLFGQRAGKAQRRGETAGELPAAAHVAGIAELLPCREVGVAGARGAVEVRVIAAARVRIADEADQRRAAGLAALVEAGDHFHGVLLASGGGSGVAARGAAAHEGGDGLHIRRETGGQALDDRADGGGVGLAKDRDPQFTAHRVRHVRSLPMRQSRQRSRDRTCPPPPRREWSRGPDRRWRARRRSSPRGGRRSRPPCRP